MESCPIPPETLPEDPVARNVRNAGNVRALDRTSLHASGPGRYEYGNRIANSLHPG